MIVDDDSKERERWLISSFSLCFEGLLNVFRHHHQPTFLTWPGERDNRHLLYVQRSVTWPPLGCWWVLKILENTQNHPNFAVENMISPFAPYFPRQFLGVSSMSFAHPRLWQLALATFMKIARPGDERPKVKEKSVDIHVRGFSDFNCQHGNPFYIYIYI